MNRLLATLRLDFQLQGRYKVYLIVIGVALILASSLGALFSPAELQFFMPIIILSGVSVTTLFLVGLLVLMERDEGTLDVVLVSPLRPTEYLASKLITLSALAVVESLIIAIVSYGLGFSMGWLLLSVVMRAAISVSMGIVIGVRYRSVFSLLLPVIMASVLFDSPNLWYLNIVPEPFFYLVPTMPTLLFAKAAFYPVDLLSLAYAAVFGSVVVLGSLFWAKSAIDTFVVRGEISA